MKAVNKELIDDDTTDLPATNDTALNNDKEDSSDDDLFNKLRKMRDDNELTYKSDRSNNRKRNLSLDSDTETGREKMHKIDEIDEKSDNEDDILTFAKKTLQQDLPDTEDILSILPSKAESGKVFFKAHFSVIFLKYDGKHFYVITNITALDVQIETHPIFSSNRIRCIFF